MRRLPRRSMRTSPRWWCWPASCASSRPAFVERYAGRLVNIHPVAAAGVSRACTRTAARCRRAAASPAPSVHLVTAELDHGPILDQAVVPVLPDDTEQTLAARVLTQEHLIYPRALEAFLGRGR